MGLATQLGGASAHKYSVGVYVAEGVVTEEYGELKKSIETRIYVQLAFMFVFTIVIVFVD